MFQLIDEREQANVLEIIQMGHPVLRQQATDVLLSQQQDKLLPLAFDMQQTMKHASGVGLAAPQIELGLRMVLVSSKSNERYPEAPTMQTTVLLNPEIVWRSEEQAQGWEGCLSIPGLRGMIPRHAAIRVSYETMAGEALEQEFSGFIARIIQHEVDHLDGVLFPERVESMHDLITEKELKRRLRSAVDE